MLKVPYIQSSVFRESSVVNITKKGIDYTGSGIIGCMDALKMYCCNNGIELVELYKNKSN